MRRGPPDGTPDHIEELVIELAAEDGGLRLSGDLEATLAIYGDDYVLSTSPAGQVSRNDFVRGADGRIVRFRDRGRIYAHQISSTMAMRPPPGEDGPGPGGQTLMGWAELGSSRKSRTNSKAH